METGSDILPKNDPNVMWSRSKKDDEVFKQNPLPLDPIRQNRDTQKGKLKLQTESKMETRMFL